MRSSRDQSPSTDEQAVRAVIEALSRATRAKDVEGVAGLQAPDLLSFDIAPPLATKGVDREALKAWFDTWEGPLEHEVRDLAVTVRGDLAVTHGFVRIAGTKKSGDKSSVWVRATTCLEKREGAWRIVHDHVSVPFYMDGSFKAAVDLEP